MSYKSFKNEVLKAFEKAKEDICNEIGTFVIAEAQNRTPVDTGNLRRSEVFEVIDNNSGINVGVTPEAPYGLLIEKGSSTRNAKPFLEPSVMENINEIQNIVEKHIIEKMGG